MKIKRMPRNMKIMKNFIQPGYSLSVNSPVPRKTPTSKRKETARMRSKTILAMTSLTMATNLVEAMTRKAIVNAAMELRFFFGVFFTVDFFNAENAGFFKDGENDGKY